MFYAEFGCDEGERYELFVAGGYPDGSLPYLERTFEDDEKDRLVASFREDALDELCGDEEPLAAWVDEWISELGLCVLRGEDPEVALREHVLGHELDRRMHAKVAQALGVLGDRRPEACTFFVAPEDDGRPWWVGFMEASPEELRRLALRFGEEVRWVHGGKTPVLMREALEEGYPPDELCTVPDC